MRLCLIVLCLFALGACALPSRHFSGIEATRIAVDGSVFDVRVRGRLAEAIRVNPQYAPRLGPIADRASVAMAQASGCRVIGVLGDQALQIGQLDCGEPRAAPRQPTPQYSCLELPSQVERADGRVYLDYDCTSY